MCKTCYRDDSICPYSDYGPVDCDEMCGEYNELDLLYDCELERLLTTVAERRLNDGKKYPCDDAECPFGAVDLRDCRSYCGLGDKDF